MGNPVNIENLIQKGKKEEKKAPSKKPSTQKHPFASKVFEVFDKLASADDSTYDEVKKELKEGK